MTSRKYIPVLQKSTGITWYHSLHHTRSFQLMSAPANQAKTTLRPVDLLRHPGQGQEQSSRNSPVMLKSVTLLAALWGQMRRRWQELLGVTSCWPSAPCPLLRLLWGTCCLLEQRNVETRISVNGFGFQPTTGVAPSPSSPTPLTGLLDSGGGGRGHGLSDIAKTIGSGSSRWARGQRSRGWPSELPHPLLSLVLSPLPIHILRVPGCSLSRETPPPNTAVRQETAAAPDRKHTMLHHAKEVELHPQNSPPTIFHCTKKGPHSIPKWNIRKHMNYSCYCNLHLQIQFSPEKLPLSTSSYRSTDTHAPSDTLMQH